MTTVLPNGKCPKCKNRVLQKSGTMTKLRIKGGLFFDDDGNASAQCHWCKERLTVPVDLQKGEAPDEENFTIPERVPDPTA